MSEVEAVMEALCWDLYWFRFQYGLICSHFVYIIILHLILGLICH